MPCIGANVATCALFDGRWVVVHDAKVKRGPYARRQAGLLEQVVDPSVVGEKARVPVFSPVELVVVMVARFGEYLHPVVQVAELTCDAFGEDGELFGCTGDFMPTFEAVVVMGHVH